uniref:Uncharacterized protein n=1 Tax=Romanomermis culicivorax TaxID=13658 RepID=A0A915K641_ROMCU
MIVRQGHQMVNGKWFRNRGVFVLKSDSFGSSEYRIPDFRRSQRISGVVSNAFINCKDAHPSKTGFLLATIKLESESSGQATLILHYKTIVMRSNNKMKVYLLFMTKRDY